MKWVKKGWLAPSYTSEDGRWKIYHDEFGQVACKKVGTNKGWYLGVQDIGGAAFVAAEAKIKNYLEANKTKDKYKDVT